MRGKNENRSYFTDRMVLMGIWFGAIYWLIETFLHGLFAYDLNFTYRLFGPDLEGMSTRIIALCFFLILGSHSQYIFNKRKELEDELKKSKEINEKLQQEIQELKKT